MTGRFRSLATLLLTVGLLAAPVPAAAMTRPAATKIALAKLKPQRTKGPVVVFALDHRLKPSDGISEPSPSKASKATGVAPVGKGKAVGKRAWLFWMDLHYRSGFAHPSVMLLLDDRTGRVIAQKRLRFWPRVNGKDAPFVVEKAYVKLRYAVFKRLVPAEAFKPSAKPAVARPALTNRELYKDDCLYSVGGVSVPKSYLNFASYLNHTLGMRWFTAPGPEAPRKEQNEADYERGVDEIAKVCKDIIIYISGHGDGGSIQVGEPGKGGRETDLWLNAAHIANWIAHHPQNTFKLVIDSCSGGAFGDEVRRLLEREHATNLVIDVTSVTGNEFSFAYVGTDGEYKNSFTEGLLDGMRASEDEVKDDCSGAPAGARLIELGFGSRSRGVVERILRRTPTVHSNLPPYKKKPCPEQTGTPGGGGGDGTGTGGGGNTPDPCATAAPLDGSLEAVPNPVDAGESVSLFANASGGVPGYTIEIDDGNGNLTVGTPATTSYPDPAPNPDTGNGKGSYTATVTITDKCGNQIKRTVNVTVLCSGVRVVTINGQTYLEICGHFSQHATKVRWQSLSPGVDFNGSQEFYESDPGQAAVCTTTQCDVVAKTADENRTHHFGALLQTNPPPAPGQQFRVTALDENGAELEHIDIMI